jgi:hypothetical protein
MVASFKMWSRLSLVFDVRQEQLFEASITFTERNEKRRLKNCERRRNAGMTGKNETREEKETERRFQNVLKRRNESDRGKNGVVCFC